MEGYHYDIEANAAMKLLQMVADSQNVVLITAHHFLRYVRMVDKYGIFYKIEDFSREYPELDGLAHPTTDTSRTMWEWYLDSRTVGRDYGFDRRLPNGHFLLAEVVSEYWNPEWKMEGVRRKKKGKRRKQIQGRKPRSVSSTESTSESPNGDVEGDAAQAALDTLLEGLRTGKLRVVRSS